MKAGSKKFSGDKGASDLLTQISRLLLMGVPEDEIIKTLLTSSTEAEIKRAMKSLREEYADKGNFDEDEEIGKGIERGSMFVGKAARVMDYKTAIAAQKLLVDLIKLKRTGKSVRNVLQKYTKRGRGRPPKYSKELANRICERIANGEMLINICIDDDMPERKTVYNWMDEHEDFLHNYTRACEIGAHALVEQGLEILDNSSPDCAQMDNNRANYRRWLAGKRNPRYGDKQSLEVTGANGGPMESIVIGDEARIAPILDRLDAIRKQRQAEENNGGTV